MSLYQLLPVGVRRNADGVYIPPDVVNNDWRAYQAWVAAGGVPDPLDPVFAQQLAAQIADGANRAAARADALVTLLATKTPAQIDAYIVANVTDLASAKTVLRALAQVVGVLASEL
jgi:hypothetical protein